ncbi:MAG TPA: serine protease, partial [Tepidisphaeraceae bacterium]
MPALLFCVLMTAAARAAAPDFDALGKSLLQIQVLDKGEYKGHGTGFYVSYDGKILTNFHVIEPVVRQKMQIEAKTNGPDKPGRRLELWQAWPEYDLALLVPADAFPGEAFKPLILAPNEPKQATQVWAFGFANDRHLGTSVTSGIVSGVRSVDDLRTMLPGLVATAAKDARWVQSDCTINPGNSGG